MTHGRSLLRRRSAAICSVIAALQPATAVAQSAEAPPAPATAETVAPLGGWDVRFTPYGWFTFLTGSQTIKGRTVDLDVDPVQVLEHLGRAPWFSYLEARNGRLSFYNDVMDAKLVLDASAVRVRHQPFAAATAAALGVSFEQTIVETGATWELVQWRQGGGGLKDRSAFSPVTAIDVVAGARYWRQDMALDLTLSAGADVAGLVVAGQRAIARSGSVDWVDPLIGLRLRHQPEPGLELVVRADAGGFGAGSRISWNGLVACNWDLMRSDSFTSSLYIGYRTLKVDYRQGSGRTRYEYDIVQHGPVAGVTLRF